MVFNSISLWFCPHHVHYVYLVILSSRNYYKYEIFTFSVCLLYLKLNMWREMPAERTQWIMNLSMLILGFLVEQWKCLMTVGKISLPYCRQMKYAAVTVIRPINRKTTLTLFYSWIGKVPVGASMREQKKSVKQRSIISVVLSALKEVPRC